MAPGMQVKVPLPGDSTGSGEVVTMAIESGENGQVCLSMLKMPQIKALAA